MITIKTKSKLLSRFKYFEYDSSPNVQMSDSYDDLVEEFERLIAMGDEEEKKVKNPKTGDYVIYNKVHKARVIRPMADGQVRIKFDNKDLHPNKMNVPAESLEWVFENGTRKKYINPEVACPKCDVAWKKSLGFNDIYFDCPKCGMKKEDAV